MIADALQIRHHFQGGAHLAQIARHGLLAQEQRQAGMLDGAFLAVHGLVALDDLLCAFCILIFQSGDCVVHSLHHEVPHFLHAAGQVFQLCIIFTAVAHCLKSSCRPALGPMLEKGFPRPCAGGTGISRNGR